MDISVTIAAYNAERTLQRAIDSILHQTVSVAEIVLIDDGSTDGTADIARSYDSKVRYFRYENAGLSVARNRGIEKATSEWIAFLDADDEWLPGFIASQIALIQRNPGLKWGYCHQERVGANGAVSSYIPPSVRREGSRNGSVSYFRAALTGFYFGTCGYVIHRSVFDEVGTFDPVMRNGMDGDLWRRIALRYPRVGLNMQVCWRYYCDNPRALHHQGRWCRDLQMRSVCRNMRRAMELGSDVALEYGPYGRMLVMRDLMRQAARDCIIAPDIRKDARNLFALTMWERGLLRVLRLLPKPIAVRVVDRLLVF